MGLFGRGGSSIRRATGPLAEFYAGHRINRDSPCAEARLLAVDVETTGLKPGRDTLLSIGWVEVNGGDIPLKTVRHYVFRGTEEVGQSATIHGIMDDARAAGDELAPVLSEFLQALQGRLLLVHFAPMEHGFLSHQLLRLWGGPLKVATVDTFAIERRHMERMGTYPRGEDLRLPRARQRYGLPWTASHNAAVDAVACAELYLAQVAHSRASTVRPFIL